VQDVLRLDNGARMNVPGRAMGNWSWRMAPSAEGLWEALQPEAAQLRELCKLTDRLAPDSLEQAAGVSAAPTNGSS
jgi:4-alpha-glucanotransferase